MCLNSRYIYNHFSRRHVLVKCGKCEACRQEKAFARAQRIKNNVTDGTIALFITLTYSNDYVPYCLKEDFLGDSDELLVYRDAECRYTYSRSKGYSFKKESGTHVIYNCYLPYEERIPYYNRALKPLNGKRSNQIGVCLYSDIQKFFKRLRQILQRNYHYEKEFSYFSCSEYGGHSHRPHFHALIFINKDDEKTFRNAIVKAWPYADCHRTKDYIQVARDAANYCASYVNGYSDLPACLQNDNFRQKHSQSKNFGVVLDCFSLSTILSKIDSGDLRYYCSKKFDGTSCFDYLPIPKYVLSRYFPQFKGLSWLTASQLRDILLSPEKCGDYLGDFSRIIKIRGILNVDVLSVKSSFIENSIYVFTPKETYQIYVRLENAYQRFYRETGLSRFDYYRYYVRCWSVHASNILVDSHKDIEHVEDYFDFYDNATEFVDGLVDAPTLPDDIEYECDPNARRWVVDKHLKLMRMYDKLDKSRKVVNFCMSHMGHQV